MSSHADACFHCGQAVPHGRRVSMPVFDMERHFCCTGCHAVCHAIVDAGLQEYYRHRDEFAERGGADAIPDVLRKLDLYDRPDIQKGFVRARGGSREAHLVLENVRCAACLWLNERHLRQLDGVLDVEIDYATQRARVGWDPERIQLSEILRAIAAIGYIAHPYDPALREELLKDEKRRSGQRLLFAGLAGMPVMQFSLANYLMGSHDAAGELLLWVVMGRWASLFAVVAVLLYSGQDFFVGAWRDLRNRRLGMDVPIVIGLVTAFVGSLAATIAQHGEVYYDSIAMFVFFLLIARHVEMRGRRAAAAALDRVARVVPATARRIDPAGEESEVAVVDLQPGDRIRLRPGETAPVDGIIAEGASSFDESLLTGELLPVLRRTGDRVIGGACNREQAVVLQVACGLADSAPHRVQRLLDEGLRARPRYAVLAERAAGWFVVAVLAVAIGTGAVWYWLDPAVALGHCIAVLIVTCPCALALATPVALALSAGRFAELGVLPVRMDAIEAFACADLMVLDKTGTITEGNPSLLAVHAVGRISRGQAQRIALALEQHSEHPIARGLRGRLEELTPLEAEGIENVPGQGVQGVIDGIPWRLGAPEFAMRDTVAEPRLCDLIEELRTQGLLVQVLADARGAQAVLAMQDRLRVGASELVSQLQAQHLTDVAILSGDHPAAVDRLAASLGVTQTYAQRTPAAKLDWIRRRQQAGQRVIMIGDGINDAPTLAAADVSFSFQGATELAQIHSDFILLGGDLRVLPKARLLAIRTRRTLLQNLLWAAGYNLLAVPFAALGWIPPWAAAIGMSLSSLVVVGNAWRV